MRNILQEIEYWSIPGTELVRRLNSNQAKGLSNSQAKEGLISYGKNLVKSNKKRDSLSLLISQFKTPIIIIFIFTAVLSFFLGEKEDAIIIIIIVVISGILGFWQEKRANEAVNKLLAIVEPKCKVIRDGILQEVVSEVVIPGDIVVLKSGDSVPADCLILECNDLFVNEATLTGESYPSEKSVRTSPKEAELRDRANCLFKGTFIVSGAAKAIITRTGASTELGNISDRRCYLLLEGKWGLPMLLMKDVGLNSGFMIPQYTTAALVTENKTLCFPASADSIPTSLGQEDHVSMGSISGRKLNQVLDNLEFILAIELLSACQAIEFRRPLKSSEILESAHDYVRQFVGFAEEDRIFADDIEQIKQLISNFSFVEHCNAFAGKKKIHLNTGFGAFSL